MSDLVAFLRARIDEDEAAAKAATPGPWVVGRTSDPDGEHYGSHVASMGAEKRMLLTMTTGYTRSKHVPTAEHVVRYDPARALREVAAKRAVLDGRWGGPDHADMWDQVIRHLASVWRDHPDYDPAWAG